MPLFEPKLYIVTKQPPNSPFFIKPELVQDMLGILELALRWSFKAWLEQHIFSV